MATQMATSPDVSFSIYKKTDFLNNQPNGWSMDRNTGKLQCDDQAVTVFSKDNRIQGERPAVEITSLADLDAFMQRVQSKPILTTALCSKPYSHSKTSWNEAEESDTSHHVVEYVVLVNTKNQQIAQIFQEAYDKAKNLIEENKKFRVTISISDSLRLWYIQNVRMENQADSVTTATNCDIYLVNGASEPGCLDGCFSCEYITQKAMWCVCFPLFFLCFVPYRIYKSCIVGLVEKEVRRKLPVTYHDTAYQLGFNIMYLLYPPGTTFTTITNYYQQPVVQQQPYPYQSQPYPQPAQPYQQAGQPYQQAGQPYQQAGQPYQPQGSPYQQQGSPYQQPAHQQPLIQNPKQ